ncbi:MAG: hypothetical protein QOE37_2014 [Microbacteriaceae bacterium]|nr:hypothetical protein [Microbacteriaceae bacterium]
MDLVGKLQVKPGTAVAVLNAPPGLELAGVERGDADAPAVLEFVTMRAELEQAGPAVEAAREDRLAWIAYPKAGRLGTDLNRDRLAEAAGVHGIRPVRQVSLDETWSALRFRPGSWPSRD